MSMLKGMMIDTLRDSTEIEPVWRLRRVFLDRNLESNMSTELKEHVIHLSDLFIESALYQSNNSPDGVMDEIYHRSQGMAKDIDRAFYEMENEPMNDLHDDAMSGTTLLSASCQNWNAQSVIPTRKIMGPGKKGKKRQKEDSLLQTSSKRVKRLASLEAGRKIKAKQETMQANMGKAKLSRKAKRRYNAGLNVINNFSSSFVKGATVTFKNTEAPRPSLLGEDLNKSCHAEKVLSFTQPVAKPKDNVNIPKKPGKESSHDRNCRMVPVDPPASFVHPLAKFMVQNQRSLQNSSISNVNSPCTSSAALLQSFSIPGGKIPSTDSGKALDRQNQSATQRYNEACEPNMSIDENQEDSTLENMMALSPILDIANFYLEMENKDTMDPFIALKTCAIETSQKIKFVNERILNADGSKSRSISCRVFIKDIFVVSIVVPLGTKSDDARRQLASTALNIICLPYLQLVSDGADGLKLEASAEMPFQEKNAGQEGISEHRYVAPSIPSCSETLEEPQENTDPEKNNARDGVNIKVETCVSALKQEQSHKTSCVDQVSDTTTPSPAPSVHRKFDSFLAWVTETDPVLAKIRYLGHMYTTLPVFPATDASIMLKFLSNASGIQIDLFTDQHFSTNAAYAFNIAMDGKILLTSSCSNSEREAIESACANVLQKVSMPYLCLRTNALQAGHQPFPRLTEEDELAEDIVYDNWDHVGDKNSPDQIMEPPVRFSNFFLTKSGGGNYYRSLLSSALAEKRKLVKDLVVTAPGKGLWSVKLDGQLVGQTNIYGKRKFIEPLGEDAFRNLRQCHWLMYKNLIRKADKYVKKEDLEELLPQPNTNNTEEPLGSNNKGLQLMMKMGYSGGGIGKFGTGIAEPISVEILRRNSGLGFQQGMSMSASTSFARAGNGEILMKDIIQAYADSPFQRPLSLPLVCPKELAILKELAGSLDLVASVAGKKSEKTALIKKKDGNTKSLFYEVLKAGGMCDKYKLIPPERKPPESEISLEEMPFSRETTMISTEIQCSLIGASPLEKLRPGLKVEITRDYDNIDNHNNNSSEEEKESECEYEEDDDKICDIMMMTNV